MCVGEAETKCPIGPCKSCVKLHWTELKGGAGAAHSLKYARSNDSARADSRDGSAVSPALATRFQPRPGQDAACDAYRHVAVILRWMHRAAAIGLALSAGLTLSSCSSDSPADTVAPPPSTAAPTSTTSAPSSSQDVTTAAPATTATTPPPPTTTIAQPVPFDELELVAYPVPAGSRPHDVAPAADGGVWYTAQGSGELGWLDPESGETRHIDLGPGSRPHGVIVDDAGAAWVTDSGRNSIERVDPTTSEVTEYALPPDRSDANLNTAAFDAAGKLWFTGQNGVVGVLEPATGNMDVFDSPRGRGPYGIAATPFGSIYFASLAGNYVGFVAEDGSITVLEPPTAGQGARRVWADSSGSVWVSEWNSGQLSRYEPASEQWDTWLLPGGDPSAYAVYVDETDIVWVSDFGGNAIHRFDPVAESFETFPLPSNPGNVRQILGRSGEVWGAESASDQLIVIRRIGS